MKKSKDTELLLDTSLWQNIRKNKAEPVKLTFEGQNLKNYQSPNLKKIGQLSHLIMGNSGVLQDFITPTQVP